MENVKAINYTGFNYQSIGEERVKENLRLMKKMTACNTVIIILGALQEQTDSREIDFEHAVMPKDSDLVDFIRYAKTLGLQVFLKPVIDCQDGSERETIDFTKDGIFQKEVFDEWFKQYTEFILHYATIAEKTSCEMFFVGCRLVRLEKQDEEWRNLIDKVRSIYQGNLTYEADVYCENQIGFWKFLDVISSAGNYPCSELGKEMERLAELAAILHMELFLSECGCMSTKGAADSPKSWGMEGLLSLQEQVEFMQNVFEQCRRQKQVKGIGVWCWSNRRQLERTAARDKHYYIYGKPVCGYIYHEWVDEIPIQVAI